MKRVVMLVSPPLVRAVALAAVILSCAVYPARAADIIKNADCMECHSDDTLMSTNAAGRAKLLFVDEKKLAASVHKTNACVTCHSDITRKHPDDEIAAKPVDCTICHERQSESYGASVHGMAARAGETASANCQDCHDGHTVAPPTSPLSPLHFSNLSKTCGACHEEAAKDVAESIHGKASSAGYREAATCTDCHSEHKIESLASGKSLKISKDVCSNCHASEKINTKFRMPKDRVKTFFESYHGMASQYGSTLAANCGSCHGYHKILPSTAPASTIHTNNLVATCGKCHPGATEKFAMGKVHVDIASASAGGEIGEALNWWVRRIYLIMIFVVIGVMVLHNGILFARKFRASIRSRQRTVIRMDRSQRIQHMILAASFIILAITGFALKYPDSWIAAAMGSSEPFRRWSHRVAGVVLLVVGMYHLWYIAATRSGRRLVKDFLPTWKDVKDTVAATRYLLGLSSEKPKFGRFGYPEKMEYWAVVWGTIIMGVTGVMIWFKMDVTQYVPRWAVDVALTIHYYEAILACLAIVVWHFYHVIFDPEVYPLNMACWDGKVTEHWQHEEHPLDQTAQRASAASHAQKAEEAETFTS